MVTQNWAFFMVAVVVLVPTIYGGKVSLKNLLHSAKARRTAHYADKKDGRCPPFEPFQCPSGQCIPIKFLCDGSNDCSDGYDENDQMCTAAVRPPVGDTQRFLQSLLGAHGPDFLVPVFGDKAKNNLLELGGVEAVAIALTQSPTAEEFGETVGMSKKEVKNLKESIDAIGRGETAGLKGSEANGFRFFAERLIETGF